MAEQAPSGFKDLLSNMMKRRWYITALVLGGFMLIIAGMFAAIMGQSPIAGEWKELLLLLLGAFIGSYGKIIDYWFSDTDKDKMLVQKMDEEDGTSLSNTADMPVTPPNNTPLIPEAFTSAIQNAQSQPVQEFKNTEESVVSLPKTQEKKTEKKGVEIDEYFAHRQCEHIWGDVDGDGDEECLKCGKIKDEDAEMVG